VLPLWAGWTRRGWTDRYPAERMRGIGGRVIFEEKTTGIHGRFMKGRCSKRWRTSTEELYRKRDYN
jgi:hypothetical protein